MNLEQYKKWLEEYANKEERQAYDVEVKVIPKAKKKEIKKPTTTPWEAV